MSPWIWVSICWLCAIAGYIIVQRVADAAWEEWLRSRK